MPLDRRKLERYSIHDRPSLVTPSAFAKECVPGKSFEEFLQSLPNFLQANGLLDLIDCVVGAVQKDKPILVLYGAHVVKVGLSPLFCQALSEGWVTYAATNGAGTIHDLELARFGRTSEDVAASLDDGSFGMARETGTEWNEAVHEGSVAQIGLGEAVGRWILSHDGQTKGDSILATANERGRPVTSHVAIGTDITHSHPEANGADLGATSYRDFERLCERVIELHEGGVVINIGSAVILPEVFLKALAVARNLHGPVESFTAANLDMNRHYRPLQNILNRPTQKSGKALEIIGPHEILVPMLFQGVCERLGSSAE